MFDDITYTAEEIAKHYSAALDSVTVISDLMALDSRNEIQTDTLTRNVNHLKIMVTKDYWTTEDLTPLSNAISSSGL